MILETTLGIRGGWPTTAVAPKNANDFKILETLSECKVQRDWQDQKLVSMAKISKAVSWPLWREKFIRSLVDCDGLEAQWLGPVRCLVPAHRLEGGRGPEALLVLAKPEKNECQRLYPHKKCGQFKYCSVQQRIQHHTGHDTSQRACFQMPGHFMNSVLRRVNILRVFIPGP